MTEPTPISRWYAEKLKPVVDIRWVRERKELGNGMGYNQQHLEFRREGGNWTRVEWPPMEDAT